MSSLLQIETWTRDELGKQERATLVMLCDLISCPKSGRKDQIVDRLLQFRELRVKIGQFRNAEEMTKVFSKKELRAMAEIPHLWKSGNKTQLATALLQWRNECRVRGQMALEEYKAAWHGVTAQKKLF